MDENKVLFLIDVLFRYNNLILFNLVIGIFVFFCYSELIWVLIFEVKFLWLFYSWFNLDLILGF